jgi:hypothetical protein
MWSKRDVTSESGLHFATFRQGRESYIKYKSPEVGGFLFMRRFVLIILLLGLGLCGNGFAQAMRAGVFAADSLLDDELPTATRSVATNPATQPTLTPELALATYQRRAAVQVSQLAAYSAVTVIKAQLPDTSQEGEYELQRNYSAPHTLLFKPVSFVGDKFVKSNVIVRLLQSEVDHVQKDDPAQTAISPANYKFSYRGQSQIGDRLVEVFQVKPRKKRLGLFKGRIYLDAHTGALARVEGTAVKSPSFFVKNIQFVQDYADFDSFTLPVHVHSEARARIVGRTVVDIVHRDYQPVPVEVAVAPSL